MCSVHWHYNLEQVGTCLCCERFLSCKFPVQLEVIMALMVSDPQLYLCTACVAWDCCQCVSLACLGSLAGEPGKPAWRAWVYRQARLAQAGAHCMVYLLLRLFLHQ